MKVLKGKDVWDALHRGNSARMAAHSAAKFSPGSRVRAKSMNHPGHIRLPEFVQGREGIVASNRGAFIFPDEHARGSKRSQQLYSVRFESDDLWGDESSQSPTAVFVDLFESYLENA